jgi:hypothetical protein
MDLFLDVVGVALMPLIVAASSVYLWMLRRRAKDGPPFRPRDADGGMPEP